MNTTILIIIGWLLLGLIGSIYWLKDCVMDEWNSHITIRYLIYAFFLSLTGLTIFVLALSVFIQNNDIFNIVVIRNKDLDND